MRFSWTIMLTQDPLVGSANVSNIDDGVAAVDTALLEALGKKYTVHHAKAVAEMKAVLRTGAKSFRSTGVWVVVED